MLRNRSTGSSIDRKQCQTCPIRRSNCMFHPGHIHLINPRIHVADVIVVQKTEVEYNISVRGCSQKLEVDSTHGRCRGRGQREITFATNRYPTFGTKNLIHDTLFCALMIFRTTEQRNFFHANNIRIPALPVRKDCAGGREHIRMPLQ